MEKRRTRTEALEEVTHAVPSRPPKSMDQWAPPRSRVHKPPEVSAAQRRRFAEEADDLLGSDRWGELEAGHFVAVYAACHERLYGVRAAELDVGRIFWLAKQAAGKLLEKVFESNTTVMVEFLRWTWIREEQRGKNGNGNGNRIGWRLQFSPSLASDYKVYKVRNGAAR